MENPRGLVGIRGMDKVPNARIRELCRVKGLDDKINEGVLRSMEESVLVLIQWLNKL